MIRPSVVYHAGTVSQLLWYNRGYHGRTINGGSRCECRKWYTNHKVVGGEADAGPGGCGTHLEVRYITVCGVVGQHIVTCLGVAVRRTTLLCVPSTAMKFRIAKYSNKPINSRTHLTRLDLRSIAFSRTKLRLCVRIPRKCLHYQSFSAQYDTICVAYKLYRLCIRCTDII